jgi:hypothetical protein
MRTYGMICACRAFRRRQMGRYLFAHSGLFKRVTSFVREWNYIEQHSWYASFPELKCSSWSVLLVRFLLDLALPNLHMR